MKYTYIAAQSDGRVITESIEAGSVSEVLRFLGERNLKPIRVSRARFEFTHHFLSFFRRGISLNDQIFLSRYLALMLQVGTSLLQAIGILIADIKKRSLHDFLVEARSGMERGRPLYTVFQLHERDFGPVYVNLIKAAEKSGKLDETFVRLSVSLTSQKQFRDKVKSALTYPLILLISSFLVIFLLVTYFLPRIAKIFLEGGFDPPTFSRIVFAIGLWFGKYGLILFSVLIAAVVLFIFLYKKVLFFRRSVKHTLSDLPLIKTLALKMALQRFAVTLSSFIKGGVPVTDALLITAEVVGYEKLKDALLRIAKEGVGKGLTLGDAFRRESVFPQVVISLVAISEQSGHIDEVLATLAEFYVGEIDGALKTLVAILEPVLLFLIGFFIGFIALAVIVPIFQITSQVQG